MTRFLFILFFAPSVLLVNAQNPLILKSASDTAGISFVDSTLIISIDGKEYLKIPKNNTLIFVGSAEVWDDMRVPVTSTYASGSNPPVFSTFMNSGGTFIGNAREFDGLEDYDSIPANSKLNFRQSDFSIAFWMKPDPANRQEAVILYKKNGLNIALHNKRLRVYLAGKSMFTSSLEFNSGARNFIVVCVKNAKNSVNLSLFINNKEAGNQLYNTPLMDVTAPFYIGKPEHRGYGNNYKGVLDELNFWNKVLSRREMDSLWNGSKGTEDIIAASNHITGYSFNDVNHRIRQSNNSINNINAFSGSKAGSTWQTIGLISETYISHGVYSYFFDPDVNQELFFSAQLPHSWKEGSMIEPHVHYVRPDGSKGTVVWGLEYTWANMFEPYGVTRTIYSEDSEPSEPNKHAYASFGFIDGTGKKYSSMLICRIFRDAENLKDNYKREAGLLEIDFHIRLNAFGSPDLPVE